MIISRKSLENRTVIFEQSLYRHGSCYATDGSECALSTTASISPLQFTLDPFVVCDLIKGKRLLRAHYSAS